MIKIGSNKSFRDLVSIDYNFNTWGCECPDYCRCGVIDNATVEHISPSCARDLVHEFVDKKHGDLQRLLAFMFFRHCLSEDDFCVSVCSGYYGEEINDVRLESSGYKKIAHFNTLIAEQNIRGALVMILTHHYGYILPDILEFKEWKLIEVSLMDIHVPDAGANQVSYTGYDHWDERSYPSYYPGCIVIPRGDKLKIVDGFHRWANFNSKKKRRKVKVLAPVVDKNNS